MSWMWQLDAAPAGGRCRAEPWRWSWQRPGSQAAAAPGGCAGSPPRVLGGQPHDQGLHLIGNRWSAARHGWIGPVSAQHAAVPSKQRLGRDHKDRPSGPGQEAAERREQGAVFGLEPRPWVLAAQDCQLVAEDQDLNLFGVRRPPAEHHQLKDAAQRQVDERPDHQHLQQHGSTRWRTIACDHIPAAPACTRLLAPHGLRFLPGDPWIVIRAAALEVCSQAARLACRCHRPLGSP
jgi:hypothetical protein